MSDLSAFFGPNAGYVLELYDRYLENPDAVDAETRQFFESFSPTLLTSPAIAPSASSAPVSAASAVDVNKIAAAVGLATGIREYGHLAVRTDPLGGPAPGAPELEAETYGITEQDLQEAIVAKLSALLAGPADPGRIATAAQAPTVVLVVGVNGVGKTTTVAKLAQRLKREGR